MSRLPWPRSQEEPGVHFLCLAPLHPWALPRCSAYGKTGVIQTGLGQVSLWATSFAQREHYGERDTLLPSRPCHATHQAEALRGHTCPPFHSVYGSPVRGEMQGWLEPPPKENRCPRAPRSLGLEARNLNSCALQATHQSHGKRVISTELFL